MFLLNFIGEEWGFFGIKTGFHPPKLGGMSPMASQWPFDMGKTTHQMRQENTRVAVSKMMKNPCRRIQPWH